MAHDLQVLLSSCSPVSEIVEVPCKRRSGFLEYYTVVSDTSDDAAVKEVQLPGERVSA